MFIDQENMKGGKALLDIIALITELVEKIYRERDKLIDNPAGFSEFETGVSQSFREGARKFIVAALEDLDKQISEDAYRKVHYDIQRHDTRTLITTVGDAAFTRTLYRDRQDGGYRYLLDDVLGLEAHERFTEAAEAAMLAEAARTSYREASLVLPTETGITKTTVMNKVHGLKEWMPEEEGDGRKEAEVLMIDADEDHLSEQHGRGSAGRNGKFISKLLYVYDGKSAECAGRNRIEGIHYVGGLYPDSDGTREMWEQAWDYISRNYDTGKLRKVYVCGDGAGWIRACTEWLPGSEFVLDRFHLMKHIYGATGWMCDSMGEARSELYRTIVGNHRQEFTDYTGLMARTAPNSAPVEQLQTYVLNNWEAIQTAYHDENSTGCSAEGHVSHVFSDRMSSRPMGWSQDGADSMSRLRCFVKNRGEGKIIDLVKYNREKRREELVKTGTDDAVGETRFRISHGLREHHDRDAAYIERLQASIPVLDTDNAYNIRRMLHDLEI